MPDKSMVVIREIKRKAGDTVFVIQNIMTEKYLSRNEEFNIKSAEDKNIYAFNDKNGALLLANTLGFMIFTAP